MSVDLLESTDSAVSLVPDVRPASATLAVRSPAGTLVESPTVSIGAVSTVVSTVTAQDVLILDDATGIATGDALWWGTDSAGAVVYVAEVVDETITLEAPPAGTVRVGDAIRSCTCTATITGTGLTPRGLHWQLLWRVTDGAGVTHDFPTTAHVVRQRFAAPITPAEVARYVGHLYPTATTSAPGRWRELAERASTRVRQRAASTGKYMNLVGDYTVWRDPGLCSLRIELAHEGLIPPGVDPATYMEDQERRLTQLIEEALAGSAYDANDSGGYEEAEIPRLRSIRMGRV